MEDDGTGSRSLLRSASKEDRAGTGLIQEILGLNICTTAIGKLAGETYHWATAKRTVLRRFDCKGSQLSFIRARGPYDIKVLVHPGQNDAAVPMRRT